MPISVSPRSLDQRLRSGEQVAGDLEHGLGTCRRVRQSLRPGCAAEVVEAQAEHDRAPDAPRRAHAPHHSIDERHEVGVHLICRSPRPARARAASRSSGGAAARGRRGGRDCCARAWRCRPAARPSIASSAASGTCASSPTVEMPRLRSRAAVAAPTPQIRSTGNGCRKPRSSSVGTTQEPIGLGDDARHLGEELRPCDADRQRKADLFADRRGGGEPRSRSDCRRSAPCPRTSRNASSIESPSTSGDVSSKTS